MNTTNSHPSNDVVDQVILQAAKDDKAQYEAFKVNLAAHGLKSKRPPSELELIRSVSLMHSLMVLQWAKMQSRGECDSFIKSLLEITAKGEPTEEDVALVKTLAACCISTHHVITGTLYRLAASMSVDSAGNENATVVKLVEETVQLIASNLRATLGPMAEMPDDNNIVQQYSEKPNDIKDKAKLDLSGFRVMFATIN